MAQEVLRPGPWGCPENSKGLAHGASASQNGAQVPFSHFHWQRAQATTDASSMSDVELAMSILAMPRPLRSNTTLNEIEFDTPVLNQHGFEKPVSHVISTRWCSITQLQFYNFSLQTKTVFP